MQTTIEETSPRTAADDVTRPKYAQADCGVTHVRWFAASRLRTVREARGLTPREAARRMAEFGDGGVGRVEGFNTTGTILELIEECRIDPSAELLFAAAAVYGVEVGAFSECHTCMRHFVRDAEGGAR